MTSETECGTWPDVPISEVVYFQEGPGLRNWQYRDVGIPFVNIRCLKDGRLLRSEMNCLDPEEVDAKYQHFLLNAGDYVVSSSGTLGRVAEVFDEDLPCMLNTSVIRFRPLDGRRLDRRFLKAFLRSDSFGEQILAFANGSAQLNYGPTHIKQMTMPLPPLSEQRAIGELLGSLDDRIDNLRATNATLEAIAQALFKSWFVDFDPVHAKAESRAPEGMDAAAALFPSEFEDSELGPIPKAWRAGTLKDVCRVHDSRRVPLSGAEREKRRGTYPYYGAASVMDYVDDYIFDGIYVLLAEDGSVATKGGYALTQYVWGRFWVNNHAHILEGVGGFSTEQLLLLLQRVRIQQYITGAVQAKLSQRNMFTIPAVIPPPAISKAFDSLVSPLFARIRKGTEAGNTLIQLRDVLLPSLISGKLRLSEPTEAAEAALA